MIVLHMAFDSILHVLLKPHIRLSNTRCIATRLSKKNAHRPESIIFKLAVIGVLPTNVTLFASVRFERAPSMHSKDRLWPYQNRGLVGLYQRGKMDTRKGTAGHAELSALSLINFAALCCSFLLSPAVG